MIPISVVADTNVFIDAIFNGDKSAQKILQYNNEGRIRLYFNKDTNEELYRIYGRMVEHVFKSKNTEYMFSRFGQMMYDVQHVEHKTKVDYCSDKSDNKFLDCCIDSRTNILITSDIHLENVRDNLKDIYIKYNIDIKILSPFQFSMYLLGNKFSKKF